MGGGVVLGNLHPSFGQLRFFGGQQEKFGQSVFIKFPFFQEIEIFSQQPVPCQREVSEVGEIGEVSEIDNNR